MGTQFADQYTLLHFAVGITAYFWNISLPLFLVIHTAFELIENTSQGMNIINRYFTLWPGGKPNPDTLINQIGDTTGALLGWISAYILDTFGTKQGWYLN